MRQFQNPFHQHHHVLHNSQRRTLVQVVPVAVVAAVMLLTLVLYSRQVFSSQVPEAPSTQTSVRAVNLQRYGTRRDPETRRRFPAPQLMRLVLVAGHSVYTSLDFHQAAQEGSWYLESYQKVPGEAQSFIQHIQLGVEVAATDPLSMLMFSGGQTRHDAGPRSEASSYWQVAEAMGWFNHTDVRGRAFTEEHARDSFENLLFAMCRFYELTGHYPKDVTVVSYELKAARFQDLHREAIRFPPQHFHFRGSPIPPGTKGAVDGEARTVAAFRQDPYSCSPPLLDKKLARDPFAVGAPHPSRCPEMQDLLLYCGAGTFQGHVPWEDANRLVAERS